MKQHQELERLHQFAADLYTLGLRAPHNLERRLARVGGTVSAEDFSLDTVADCIAMEQGYESWDRMVGDRCEPPEDAARALTWVLDRVLAGESNQIVERQPQLIGVLSHRVIELAMATPGALELKFSKQSVNEPLEPLDVSPLVYVCCSAYGTDELGTRERRRNLVSTLLDMGADPNAGRRESQSMRGYLTCLGGAIGQAKDPKIVEMLLAAGADPADGPSLYEGSSTWLAVEQQDRDALTLLLAAEPPEWHLCHALTHCMQFRNDEVVEALLQSGADPNWNKTLYGMGGNALHEAIHCDCSMTIVEQLIECGVTLDQRDAGGRTPIAIATALDRKDIVARLIELGQDKNVVSHFEQFVGACFGDRVDDVNYFRKELPQSYTTNYHDSIWLASAIRKRNVRAAQHLLNSPTDANAIDYQGETALHRAVAVRDSQLCQRLIQIAGASVTQVNYSGDTVIESALRQADLASHELLIQLTPYINERDWQLQGSRLKAADEAEFETAVDAVADGNVELLKSMLEEHTYFNRARSKRAHRCTLLNYVGVNGFEGERQRVPENVVDVIELLLSYGCDPNATCYTYRGGPGETTLGLYSSSGHVSPEQETAMTRAMARGGVKLVPSQQLFFDLLDAEEAGNLVERVAELKQADSAQEAALRESSSKGLLALVAALVNHGVDVNARDEQKTTSLHWAAFNGQEQVVNWLLEHGADHTLLDAQFGGNAEGWAQAGGHPELAKRIAGLTDRS